MKVVYVGVIIINYALNESDRKLNSPRIAYLALWFPKPSETFIFREVLNLWKMGLSLKVFTLYGELRTQLSPEMKSVPTDQVEHLGIPALKKLPVDLAYWFHKNNKLTKRLIRTIPFRRWKSIEFGGENIFGFLCGFILARQFQEQGFDHIHAAWAMGPATAAWVASELTGIPYSFTARAGDIYPPDGALKEKIEAAKFVISDNMTNVPYLEQIAPSSKGKIFGIYNGVPLEKAAEAPVLMTPPYKILALGRFDRIKAFHILLHACKILKDSGLSFRLTLAGDGPRRLQLKHLARKLGLTDYISFPGFVPYNFVSDLFCSADVFVMSSAVHSSGDRDGLPTVIMEALAHRLPVVATDVCGIPEVIHNGETGLLVGQNDPQSLADAILAMVHDRDNALSMAAKGRELVLREFDQEKNHTKIFDLFIDQIHGNQSQTTL
ncbi:MAG: glycosyltransferase [Desulfomonilaceae bacterium]